MSTEQELLNMADDFKEVVAKKDTIIELYKEKLEEIEEHLRVMEYTQSQMEYLIEYMLEISKKEEKPFLKRILKSVKQTKEKVDMSRILCQEEVDEDIILHLG
jgi:hypothetical protein